MPTTTDMVVGVLGVLMVLEAAREWWGMAYSYCSCAFFGLRFCRTQHSRSLCPPGVTLSSLAGHLYFTTEGIFGIPLGVSATFIFLFILFGAYLEKTGLGKFL